MAFGKKQDIKEAIPFTKYLGAVIAHLEAVNPTAEELKVLTGRDINVKDYVSDTKVVDLDGKEKEGKQNAITFWFSFPNPKFGQEGEQDKVFVNLPIYLSNSCRIGSQSGKIQVIDQWGRTAWVTRDEYNNKSIPVYKSGPASISKTYRAALAGEEDLITAIKALLGTNNPSVRLSDGSYRPMTDEELNEKKDEFMCCIEPEDIKAIMSGNIKCIKSALVEHNDVKLILGIKHGDNGDYQTVYEKVLKINNNNLSRIEKDITDANYANKEYFVDGHIPNGLVEYVVNPTNVTQVKKEDAKMQEPDDLPF